MNNSYDIVFCIDKNFNKQAFLSIASFYKTNVNFENKIYIIHKSPNSFKKYLKKLENYFPHYNVELIKFKFKIKHLVICINNLLVFRIFLKHLDIDSIIEGNLSEIIDENDDAVITAEKNENCYVQWSLIFNKNHPILEKTIENLVKNIEENKYKNDVLNFSVKPYWDAINNSFIENNLKFSWEMINEDTNKLFNISDANFRIYSVDYGKYISFKHKYNHLLRDRGKLEADENHWTISQNSQNVFD